MGTHQAFSIKHHCQKQHGNVLFHQSDETFVQETKTLRSLVLRTGEWTITYGYFVIWVLGALMGETPTPPPSIPL